MKGNKEEYRTDQTNLNKLFSFIFKKIFLQQKIKK